jgi:hypothetical protein
VTTESKFIIDSLGPFDLDRQIVTLVPNFKDIHNYPQFWSLANNKPFWQIFKDIANGVFIVPREVGYEDVVLPTAAGDFPSYWDDPFYDVPSYRRYRGISNFQNRTRSVSIKYLGAGIEDRVWIQDQFFSIDKEYNATQNRFFNFITMQSWNNIGQWSPHISSIMWDNSIGYLSRVQGSNGISFSSLLLNGSQGISFWSDVRNGGFSALSAFFQGNDLKLWIYPNRHYSILAHGTSSTILSGGFGSITVFSPRVEFFNPSGTTTHFGLVRNPWTRAPRPSVFTPCIYITPNIMTLGIELGGTIMGHAVPALSWYLTTPGGPGVRGEVYVPPTQTGIHRNYSGWFYDLFQFIGRIDTDSGAVDKKPRCDVWILHGSTLTDSKIAITGGFTELGFGRFRGLVQIVGGVDGFLNGFVNETSNIISAPPVGNYFGVPCTHDAFDIYVRGVSRIGRGMDRIDVTLAPGQSAYMRWNIPSYVGNNPPENGTVYAKQTVILVTAVRADDGTVVPVAVEPLPTPGQFRIYRGDPREEWASRSIIVQWVVIGERNDVKDLWSVVTNPTQSWYIPSEKPYVAYDDIP